MDKLATLHQQLRLASGLLDDAASLIRDASLHPTREHFHRVGEALAAIAEIRTAVERLRPDLARPFEAPSEELSAANRRLGPVLLQAYDLAEDSQLADAVAVLEAYVKTETSGFHRDIARGEIGRLRNIGAP